MERGVVCTFSTREGCNASPATGVAASLGLGRIIWPAMYLPCLGDPALPGTTAPHADLVIGVTVSPCRLRVPPTCMFWWLWPLSRATMLHVHAC